MENIKPWWEDQEKQATGKVPALSNSLTALPSMKTFNDDEAIVVHYKYSAPRIGTLANDALLFQSTILLAKLHVITGWVVPTDQLGTILNDQFCKKLREDYGMLNVEEIEYAFRKTGTTVKDYGKQMNLNLIDQVLIPYLDERMRISGIEEKSKKLSEEQVIYTDQQIEYMRRWDIEEAFQNMRKGRFPIIHVYFEPILRADGFMKKKEKIANFFVRALGDGRQGLYEFTKGEK